MGAKRREPQVVRNAVVDEGLHFRTPCGIERSEVDGGLLR
jgi:hypothetical protein